MLVVPSMPEEEMVSLARQWLMPERHRAVRLGKSHITEPMSPILLLKALLNYLQHLMLALDSFTFFFLKTGSHVVHTRLKLATLPRRMALTSRFSCLHLLNVGITGSLLVLSWYHRLTPLPYSVYGELGIKSRALHMPARILSYTS